MKKSSAGNKDKGKKATKEPQAPQTWEEYMEGERYATGDKARRFYEKAGDMYNKACKLNPEDSDCLYNLQKLSLLNASIDRFRSALSYDSDNADTLFNLGQALTTHAEVIQDHDEEEDDEEGQDHTHGDKDYHLQTSPEERAALQLQEASSLFETCYSIQQRELYAALQETRPKDGSAEDKPAALIQQEKKELSNAAGVLIDTLISASQALTSLAFLVETVERSQAYYKQASDKLDIALGVANDKLLWADDDDKDQDDDENASSTSRGKDKEPAAELIVDGDDDILPASKPVSTFREAESQSDTVSRKEKVCDIHLQYSTVLSSQTDRHYQDTGRISEELYEKSMKHLNVVLKHQPRHVEALCDKGDLLGAWAQGLAAFGPEAGEEEEILSDAASTLTLGTSDAVAAEPVSSKSGSSSGSGSGASGSKPSGRSARAWQLFALATRAFLSALEVEPQNTSILEKLGDIHWSRSQLSSATAVKNRAVLLNNASVYYRFAWESCRDASSGQGEGAVDEDQRQEILLSWAQVLRAIPGKEEEVVRVLKQWKRIGGSKEMLKEMLQGESTGDILRQDFVEFALQLVRKGLQGHCNNNNSIMTRTLLSAAVAASAFMLLAMLAFMVAPGGVEALKFDLPAENVDDATPRCLSMYIDAETHVELKVKAGPGPHQKLSVVVTDDSEHANQLWKKDSLTEALQKASFIHKHAGDVVICFTNVLSDGLKPDSRYSRTVEFTIQFGSETVDYVKVAKEEKLKPMEVELRKLEDIVKDVMKNMIHLQKREEIMRDTNESTNARVKWFSTMTMGVLLLLGLWQIFYLKRFFRKKRLID
ncbi:vesicle coat component [Dissophora globulifera]|nr:vesicle coat component [Dissophora globulifera]